MELPGTRNLGPASDLEVMNKIVSPDGFLRSCNTNLDLNFYKLKTVLAGGTFPGPLIRTNKGDEPHINIINQLYDTSMNSIAGSSHPAVWLLLTPSLMYNHPFNADKWSWWLLREVNISTGYVMHPTKTLPRSTGHTSYLTTKVLPDLFRRWGIWDLEPGTADEATLIATAFLKESPFNKTIEEVVATSTPLIFTTIFSERDAVSTDTQANNDMTIQFVTDNLTLAFP
ncbi:hypothetical protein J3A83DRAFT_4188118 [Scleroderma citrinum]